MSTTHLLRDFTSEQLDLWQRVNELWALSAMKDVALIREALHPEYMGWDMSTPLSHDRDAAVHSVTSEASRLTCYVLEPLSVRVYESSVGVVHYRYEATVEPQVGSPIHVSGRWTEVYARKQNRWLMVAVSGQPNASGRTDTSNSSAA